MLDLNWKPNFYANWYTTRILLKSKPSASATASASVAEVFPSTATASATAKKSTFGRPLFSKRLFNPVAQSEER